MFTTSAKIVLALGLLGGGWAGAKTTIASTNLDLMLDGRLSRCEEGGDTLGNNISYSIGTTSVNYDAKSDKVTVKLNIHYYRCELINGKATLVSQINPFSPYTYKIPVRNAQGEVVFQAVTDQLEAIQMVASKFDDESIYVKSAAASLQAFEGATQSLTMTTEFNLKSFLSGAQIEALNAGHETDIRALLTSTAHGKSETGFFGGGSYVLSFSLSKARPLSRNVSKLKLQRLN